MDEKVPFPPPVESSPGIPADPEAEIILHPVVRIRREGFPCADSAEEVRRILETVDRARALGVR